MKALYKKIKNFKNRENKTQSGFTIIETLVAILILTLAVTSAMTIAQKSLQAAEYSRDETTAYYLAAESIELVRNIRDNSTWTGNLTACTSGYCDIDPTTEAVQSCSGKVTGATPLGAYCSLALNSNNIYIPSGGGSFSSSTHFFRSIKISEVNPGVEAVVTVTVAWDAGPFNTRQISLTERIFNWR